MSGAEAIAVLGLISSVISIIDGTKKVYDAATDMKGLPDAFRVVDARLPIVQSILASAKRAIEEGRMGENSCKGAKKVVSACEKKAKSLEKLFDKIMFGDDTSRMERYVSAVRTLGKGNRVETLMKGILEDLQLLAINNGMTSERKEVAEAIKEVEALPPSLPETEDTGVTAIHSGSGSINQALGDQYNNTGSGHVYHAHSMTFGSNDANAPDFQACLTALFHVLRTDPRDDREKLVQRKGERVEGTCQWIKSHQLYERWVRSKSSELLWLSGGPGKGKTMLSIFLAAELQDMIKESMQDACLLECYCDNKDDKRNTAESIVRSLMLQLLLKNPKLFACVLPNFKVHRELSAWSFETLWRIFESMVCNASQGAIYCIIDGLDECDELYLEVLLKRLRTLFTITKVPDSCHLNLIVVSRAFPDVIPELLQNFPRIRLDPDMDNEVNQDIGQFIDFEVDKLSTYRSYPKALRLKVTNVFQDRAKGTFLWVGIVAKMLKKYRATEVEGALKLFPPGLEEIYDRMLLQIDVDRRETAAQILLWVAMAVRPLTLAELGAVLKTAPSADFDRDESIRAQLLCCGYFLTIKEQEVNFIHQSAKDYLRNKINKAIPELEIFRFSDQAGHLALATKCFDYLQDGALADGPVDLDKDTSRRKAFPLLSYAVCYWAHHAKSLARSEAIFNLSIPFHSKASRTREAWWRTYKSTFDKSLLVPSISKLLHQASWVGVLPLVENIFLQYDQRSFLARIKRRRYVNQKDPSGFTALILAVARGHIAISRLLLDYGADSNASNSTRETALHYAATQENEELVRLLIVKGADVNVRDKDGETALTLASDEAIVRILLRNGADIKVRDKRGQTLLMTAAYQGNEAIMRVLFEKGADVNATDDDGWTALQYAITTRNEAIAQILLENGADIEATDDHGWTALMCAAYKGQTVTVRTLIENGADIEAKNKFDGMALHYAAAGGHEAVTRLLLENGANIEAKNDSGITVLHYAADRGHEAVTRLLLENGANVEAKNDSGETVLHYAAAGGHEAVTRLLLENGANIEAQNDRGGTALQLAVNKGHQAAIRLLTPPSVTC